MTEKEKAALGELYDANYNTQLLEDMRLSRERCFRYNQISPIEEEKKEHMIREIFGKTGHNCRVISPFQCDYGYNIEVGDNFFSNYNCVMLDGAKIKIGNNVFVAPNCGFYTAGHPLDTKQRIAGLEYARPIYIGNNVWIGAGCSVLPGVIIGDNTVIGAGSVVNKDIPANVVAAGNPCKVIKKIV